VCAGGVLGGLREVPGALRVREAEGAAAEPDRAEGSRGGMRRFWEWLVSQFAPPVLLPPPVLAELPHSPIHNELNEGRVRQPYVNQPRQIRPHVVRDIYNTERASFWDSLALKPGEVFTSGKSLFVNCGPDSGKQLPDSNMTKSYELDHPKHMMVGRIVFSFSRDALDSDVFGLAERLVFKLRIGDKYYASNLLIAMHTRQGAAAPVRICEYCHAVYVGDRECPGCGARDFRLSGLGSEAENPGRQFFTDIPKELQLHILQGQSFCVEFVCEPYKVKGSLKLWCHLEGVLYRDVQ
jgi:hypothetical protein